METFKKGEKVGKYVIHSFIKKGIVAESYTVLGPDDMIILNAKRGKQLAEIAQKCGRQMKIVVKGRLGHREAFAVTLTGGDAPKKP